MKRQFLFTICLVFCVCVLAQNKTYEVTYKKDIDLPSRKEITNEVSRQTQRYVDTSVDLLKKMHFLLVFDKDKAVFEMEDMIPDDNKIAYILAKSMGGGQRYLINRETDKKYEEVDMSGKIYFVETPINSLKWELKHDKMTFMGIELYKAEAKKVRVTRSGPNEQQIIAWYAPSYNFPYGPAGVMGLPGLILKLKVGNINITCTKIETIKKPVKVFKIALDKIIDQKTYSRYQEDGFNRLLRY